MTPAGSVIPRVTPATTDHGPDHHRTTGISQSFRQASLGLTGAHWLDDPPNLTCKDSTGQRAVDDPLLSCKQQVGGQVPPPAPIIGGSPPCRAVISPGSGRGAVARWSAGRGLVGGPGGWRTRG